MVIFKCYFSGELTALSLKKYIENKSKQTNKQNNNNGVNIELGEKKKQIKSKVHDAN